MPQPETNLAELLQNSGQLETAPESEPETQPKRKSPVAASRQGKSVMQAHFSKEAHDQMRILCIETGKSIQELLVDAVNALFTLHNKPPIA
jgi:hypothetical protein